MLTDEQLAREAYEAYIENSGGLNYQGLPCPTWENLTEAIRGHWVVAARKVKSLVTAPEKTRPREENP